MNRFISSLELLQEYRKIKPFAIEFREGLNVLVGENGAGKSTIFHLMIEEAANKSLVRIDFRPVEYRFFDTEKQNPRTRGEIKAEFDIVSRFCSHGETIFAIVDECKKFKDTLLLIDEPEAGVSIRNQRKLVDAFQEAIVNGCQVIVATHSFVIIQSVLTVFSLDSRTWMTSKEYLSL